MIKIAILFVIAQGCMTASVKRQTVCSDFCPEYYKPVCGSNGKTYSNICFFNAAQCHDSTISLQHEGMCGGSVHAQPCPAMACFALYDPVCGTDGVTYRNDCNLFTTHCHGDVQVAHTGACAGAV